MKAAIAFVLLSTSLLGCAGAPKSEEPEATIADKTMAVTDAGYKIVDQDGERLYCRRDMQTGSRTRHTTSCITEQEREQLHDSTKQTMQDVARRQIPRQGT